MNNAIHSNMESNIQEGLVETFANVMKFKCQTDIHTKRKNDNYTEVDNDNSMKDINNSENEIPNNLPNDENNKQNQKVKDPNDKKYYLIKDFFLKSRLTKFFPHLFTN